MKEMDTLKKIEEMLETGSKFRIGNSDCLNRCIYHICKLIESSYILYKNGLYSTSLFLSITIIEEVGKAHVGFYVQDPEKIKLAQQKRCEMDNESKKSNMRKSNTASQSKKKGDPLYKHDMKHSAGLPFTVIMSGRIIDSVGEEKLEHLLEKAHNEGFMEKRNSALYCECKDGNIVIPEDVISKDEARSFLLLAIESFDDNLVGYTNYSFDVSKFTDKIFEEVMNDI